MQKYIPKTNTFLFSAVVIILCLLSDSITAQTQYGVTQLPKIRESFQPETGLSDFLFSSSDTVLSATFYTFGGLVIFSYNDESRFTVLDSDGNHLWDEVLDDGETIFLDSHLIPGGSYRVVGSRPYALLSGNPSTNVMGYFTLDEMSKPLSTHFYTYSCGEGTPSENKFIIWGYEDNTLVTLNNLGTGIEIWSGYLNQGEYFVSSDIDDVFLEITSNQPVSAQIYDDCGFFWPATDNSFFGTEFYGYSFTRAENKRVCVIAYNDDTDIVVEKTDGTLLWQGSLNEGEIYVDTLDSKFLHVLTSNPVTVCSAPFVDISPTYFHLMEVKGTSGSGIGKKFYAPCINNGNLDIFTFDDETQITVSRTDDIQPVLDFVMRANQHYRLETEFGLYLVESSRNCSVIESGGFLLCGADFITVNYNPFNLVVVPDTIATYPGYTKYCSVSYVPFFEFNEWVDLSVQTNIPGILTSFSPTSIDSMTVSTLTLRLSSDLPIGEYAIVVTGISGDLTRTDTLTLIVNEPPFVPIMPSAFSPQTAGEAFGVDIICGDENHPVQRLYAVAYTLHWDDQWLALLESEASAGGLLGDYSEIQIESQWQAPTDSVRTVMSRTDNRSAPSEYGMLSSHRFQSFKYTPDGQIVNFFLSDIVASDSAGNPIVLTPDVLDLVIERPPGVRPNPFTPNGDGFNDVAEFNFIQLREKGGVIHIFDLWGHKVRTIEDDVVWDGLDDSGNRLPPGPYLYIVKSGGKVIDKGVLGLAL